MSEQIEASEGAPAPGENVSQQIAPPEGQAQPTGNEAGSPPAAAGPGDTEHSEDKPKGVAKRLKELTDRIRAAEQREERYLRLLEQQKEPSPAQVKETETEKGLADFGYDDKKYVAYLTERATKQAVEAARVEASKWRQEQETQSRRQSFEARVEKFSAEVGDFHEVFTPDTPVSEAMADAMMDTEEGPAIAYYLGKNPDIAQKLYKLSPVQAGREIARIEDRIVAERKKAAEKPVSQAPAPAPTLGAADAGNVERDPSKMTDAEFTKWFRKKRGLT